VVETTGLENQWPDFSIFKQRRELRDKLPFFISFWKFSLAAIFFTSCRKATFFATELLREIVTEREVGEEEGRTYSEIELNDASVVSCRIKS
jgi:hypothetical protein